jgi:transcriptional regulator with XRE-family HTH domain
MRFGAMLQGYRLKAGITQAELARRSGLPLRSIQNWEAGHRNPRPEALLRLARVVGVSMEDLLTTPPKDVPQRRQGGRKSRK